MGSFCIRRWYCDWGGATILGNVWIANGITIGANALVNKNFDEEKIAIAGVPAKKISDNGRWQWGSSKFRRV